MNTLKCKALLIKETLFIFLKGIGIYLLITVPVLMAQPVFYVVSAIYALTFGWIAGFIFLILFYCLQQTKIDNAAKYFLLCMAILLSVAIALQAIELTGTQRHVWQSGSFLLFPLAAVVAGWLGVLLSRSRINKLIFSNEMDNN